MNEWEIEEVKKKQTNKKQRHKKQEERKPTKATLSIHDNVVLVCYGGENDGEEVGSLFTNTTPKHPVFFHRLVLRIGEAIKPTIFLEIVTHVFKVQGPDIQNVFITHEHIDEELVSLQEM